MTGKGTSHRVNGIAVQKKVYGPHLPKPNLPPVTKQKQRTIIIENQELEAYVSGVKVGPQPLKTETRHIPDSKEAANQAQYKNMIWVLTRQLGIDNQMVPGWTGFNIRTRDSIDVEEDIIGYLPTINVPAT